MENSIIITSTFLLLAVFSCDTKHRKTIVPKTKITNNQCIDSSRKFTNRFGYDISNYFQVSSCISKDLNKDGIQDSIAILSPLELIPFYDFCYRTNDSIVENRILLINIMKGNGGISYSYLNENVISNDNFGPIHQGEEYLDTISNYDGFVLSQRYGQGCYAKYYIYIKMEANTFIVDSILFLNKCPNALREERLKYDYTSNKLTLDNYNRNFLSSFKKKFGIVNSRNW